jgi:MATE family multidrug resistance protein
MWRIVRLGVPAAGQTLLEVASSPPRRRLPAESRPRPWPRTTSSSTSSASIFMVPFGLASAAAVRVGNGIGRGDRHAARAAGWVAILLALCVMTRPAILFASVPAWLVGLFSADQAVISIGVGLLLVAAVFQCSTACRPWRPERLRGLGDTRTPLIVNFVGHWMIGLPLAYALCFWYGWARKGSGWAGVGL